ncbi:MAG: exosortase/archaeosortase family protein, partial [Amphiplicatus sp.]
AGRMAKADIVEHFAFVSLLIAGVCLIFGARNARAFAFPLAFLYFMVPFGASALPALQETTTGLAATLLNLVGVNAGRAGFIITTAAGPFHIAPSCAGLNFLLASLMIASLFAETALSGWRARVGFVFAAAVLAIAANALRAAIVIGAATLLGGAIAADHILFGLIFYAMLIAALIAAGGRLARAS